MASCAVFDGNETSFTCGEIQGITPPHPKKNYYSDRFPLRSGSLVKTIDEINKINNVQVDKFKSRPHSRSSYRSKRSEDIFRNIDINETEEHFLPRKQRLNTVSEETGTSRRHEASIDELRPFNKQKPVIEPNPLREKRKTSMELYPAPRCRDLESTKDTSFRGKPRFQSIRESDPNRPRRRRRREIEVNDENSVRGKSRLSNNRKESRSFRRVFNSDDDDNVDQKLKPKLQAEERKPLRRRDRELNQEPRHNDRRRRHFDRDETVVPNRCRESLLKNSEIPHQREKDKLTLDRDETFSVRNRDTNRNNSPVPRGKEKTRLDRDLITSNRLRDSKTVPNDQLARGKERMNFERDIPTPNRFRDSNSALGNKPHSKVKERYNFDRDVVTKEKSNFDRDETHATRRNTNSALGNEHHSRTKERSNFEKEAFSRRKEQREIVRTENHHRTRVPVVDSDSDDAFTPRSQMMKEPPKRRDNVKNEIFVREDEDDDDDDDDDDSLLDERRVKSSSPPVRAKKRDYQSEILRLQKKMSKLQGKVSLLQKRVTHLQSQ